MQNSIDVVQIYYICTTKHKTCTTMATIKVIFRTTKKSGNIKLRFRLTDGRDVQLYHQSDIVVDIAKWDAKNDCIKAKVLMHDEERKEINNAVLERKRLMLDVYMAHKKESLDSDSFERWIAETLNPTEPTNEKKSFFAVFDDYLLKHDRAEISKKNFMVLYRCLQRFEAIQATEEKGFVLDLDCIDKDVLADFESFLRNEHVLFGEYPDIYEQFKYNSDSRKNPTPKERGNNTITNLMKKLRAFYSWCNEEEYTDNNPFSKYKIKAEKYGTPIYISIEERNAIADFDLSESPQLEVQRDIFIFQCLIGCRVSDLLKMTNENIVNDAIEYIAQKTKDEKPEVIRVPLNDRAKSILKKYKQKGKKQPILPFITSQRYNDDIKEIFRLCGITRMVTIIDPTTGNEEKKPINEVASSHMARRTFVGNLYKQVKDPNLIGALSGHKEGSRAFARYRDIDEDIKKEIVSLIN